MDKLGTAEFAVILGALAQLVAVVIFVVQTRDFVTQLKKDREADRKKLDEHDVQIHDHEVRISVVENQIA